MALICLKSATAYLTTSCQTTLKNIQQIRTLYANRHMIRDVKRRKTAVQYADERLRINSLRRNNVLPPELRAIADEEINALPRDSAPLRICTRCCVTSRPRGTVYRWRLSRIVFRDLADHNKIAGVERAIW